MIKKILLIVSIVLFFVWFSFWAEKENDCNNISYFKNLENNSDFLSMLEKNKIIDLNVYDQALINLQKYCKKNTDVLLSNIFANHLMDIAFRKLDAIEGLTYWITPDEQWKIWRDYINNVEKKYQTLPENIYNNFIKIWWTPEENIKSNTKTLYGKYLQTCEEIKNMYEFIYSSLTYNKVPITPKLFYYKCRELVKKRYNDEANLVEQIMFQNYYHIVNETLFKSFNQIYWKEFKDLYDKFMIALWDYEYMVKRFIKVTDANTW